MNKKYLMKIAKTGVYLTFFTSFGAILVFLSMYLYVGPQLPEVETLKDFRLQTPMRVYTADEKLFSYFGEKKRIPVAFDQIPEQLNQALIATEDRRFYSHGGVDAIGLARAVVQLVTTGRIGGGGSTITMQLARNFFLSFDQTFTRKTKEIFLSWKIERNLTKNDILTLYWNKINFSHRAYGVGAAAQVYYGTTVDKLTLPQLAIIAGIPKGPTTHNPISNPPKAHKRRDHVLRRMLTEGYIDQQTLEVALATPLTAAIHEPQVELNAPYLAEMVRRVMVKRFGRENAYTQGFNVYTTIDSTLQKISRRSVRQSLVDYDRRHGYRGPERHFDEVEQILLSFNASSLEQAVLNQPEQDNTEALNLSDQEQADLEEEQSMLALDFDALDEILNDIRVVGDLAPGIVVSLSEDSIKVLIKKSDKRFNPKDRLITIQWNGLSWARPFVNDNRRGKPPRTASEIVSSGDLIRVFKDTSGHWQLTQIPEVSAAFVALQPNNGAISALVGGFDFDFYQYNGVTQARRQPGSNIKPFIYSAAFEKGYTAASVVNDAPFTKVDASSENIWRPKNSSGDYKGPTRLRNALKSSTNLVSIRLLNDITPRYAVNYLANMGFERSRMPAVNSLALGAADFTPLEVATGFAIFANGGYRINTFYIRRIEDSNGNILFEEQPVTVCEDCEAIMLEQNASSESLNELRVNAEAELFAEIEQEQKSSDQSTDHFDAPELTGINDTRLNDTNPNFIIDAKQPLNLEPEMIVDSDKVALRVVAADNIFLIDSMMKDVIHHGTAAPTLRQSNSSLLKRNDLAGKTGTTNQAKDAWFSGYNGDYVATAWVGFEDYSRGLGNNEFGGKAALPIWQGFMEAALAGRPENSLKQPDGLVTAKIDPATGLLAPANMKGAIFEIFRQRYLPSNFAPIKVDDPFNEKDEEEESIF